MRAKLVNELALGDVLRGPSPSEIESRLDDLIDDIDGGSYGYKDKVKRVVNRIYGNPAMLSMFLEKIKNKDIVLPTDLFSDILSGLKYKDPETRAQIGKMLGKTKKSILDRSPEENEKDKNEAREMLLNNGFRDISGPIQKKRGTLRLDHNDMPYGIEFMIYPNGAVRRSKNGRAAKMRVEDPYLTYVDNAEYLIKYIEKKKKKRPRW